MILRVGAYGLWVGAYGYQLMELIDYGSGSVEVMFLVFEGQDSTCSCFIPPLLFISKAHDLYAHIHKILQ